MQKNPKYTKVCTENKLLENLTGIMEFFGSDDYLLCSIGRIIKYL